MEQYSSIQTDIDRCEEGGGILPSKGSGIRQENGSGSGVPIQ
jgi:hypothetical protein